MRLLLGAMLIALAGCQMSSETPQQSAGRSTVADGETVNFGEVGVICNMRKSSLGSKVDSFPREGRPVWELYDTDPSSITQRTQFITGFKDGCARQVSAALVIFGAANLHETHRYSATRLRAVWTQADEVYEKVKVKVCGVSREIPCPEKKLDRLEDQLAFVTAYASFGSSSKRLELLLNAGVLESQEVR
jgi:hypothetical protein